MDIYISSGPGGCKLIRLSGYLDASGAAVIALRWRAAIVSAAHDSLVDFSDVGGAEVLALNLLADAVQEARLRGSRVVAFGLEPAVQRALPGTRLQAEILLARDEREALARLAAG